MALVFSAIHAENTSIHTPVAPRSFRVRFWQHWAGTVFNERQAKLLNRLLDDFDGKLTSSRWASMAHCSPDTALRDINQLVALGILQKMPGGGRSTGYELAPPRPPYQQNCRQGSSGYAQ